MTFPITEVTLTITIIIKKRQLMIISKYESGNDTVIGFLILKRRLGFIKYTIWRNIRIDLVSSM